MNAETLTGWTGRYPWLALLVAGVCTVALLAIVWAARRPRAARKRAPAAVVVTGIAAAACTAYSADTSWRFAEHRLDMADSAERAAFFAAGELVLFACAFLARHNTLVAGTAGTPGTLVWLITGVQVVAAYSEAGPLGGTVRAVVGPVFAALLWHLAMGVELRHRRPEAAGGGFVALVARDVRERVLSRLGVVERDRDAAQITRDRWTCRAVEHAARLAVMNEAARGGRAGRRLRRRLSTAVARAEVGVNEAQRERLLQLLAARRNAAQLAAVALPSPWAPAAMDQDGAPAALEVELTRQHLEALALPTVDVYPAMVSAASLRTPAASAAYPMPGEVYPAAHEPAADTTTPDARPTPAVLAAQSARTRPEVQVEYVPDEDPHTADARVRFAEGLRIGSVPSVRTLRERYSIGQARAQRIRDELAAGVRS